MALLSLPDELLERIFHISHAADRRDTAACLRLCKRSYPILLSLLYRKPEILSISQLRKFSRALHAHTTLSSLVHELTVNFTAKAREDESGSPRPIVWSAVRFPVLPNCRRLSADLEFYSGSQGIPVTEVLLWASQCLQLRQLRLGQSLETTTGFDEEWEGTVVSCAEVGIDLPQTLKHLELSYCWPSDDEPQFWRLLDWAEVLEIEFTLDGGDRWEDPAYYFDGFKTLGSTLRSLDITSHPFSRELHASLSNNSSRLERLSIDIEHALEISWDLQLSSLKTLLARIQSGFSQEVDSIVQDLVAGINAGQFPALEQLNIEDGSGEIDYHEITRRIGLVAACDRHGVTLTCSICSSLRRSDST